MEQLHIRSAGLDDAEALRAIYAPYAENTVVSFEYHTPDAEQWRQRMRAILGEYPYLVCESNGAIAGYTYAHRHMERDAYQWNAELSIYLSEEYQHHGLGRMLYSALMTLLAMQGIRTVYAGVTLPNPASETLHARLGFRPCGVLHHTGYKMGAWHDVVWFEKALSPALPDPAPPRRFDQLHSAEVRQVFDEALAARCKR